MKLGNWLCYYVHVGSLDVDVCANSPGANFQNAWTQAQRYLSVTPRHMILPLVTHPPYHTADPAMVTQLTEWVERPCWALLLKMMQHDGQASFCFKRNESAVLLKSSLLAMQREKIQPGDGSLEKHDKRRDKITWTRLQYSGGTAVDPGVLQRKETVKCKWARITPFLNADV